MWLFRSKKKGSISSGFSSSSTAEEVTQGIDGSALTAIVTGATSGLGEETSRVLALRGVDVIMGVRNMAAARDVKENIIKKIPTAKLDIMELDLSSMASVKKFAANFNSSGRQLNLLINNAGIGATPYLLSKDKIEMQFATNYLGHFLLTNLLLETMKRTSKESSIEGRIINVSSEGHRFMSFYSEGICFDKLNQKIGYGGFKAYSQSKLANILHANELTRRLKEDEVNITANSLHPGVIMTKIISNNINGIVTNSTLNGLVTNIGKYWMKTVEQGAATICYIALNPQVKGVSGEYFVDNNLSEASATTRNMELGKKLWDFTVNLID